MGKGRHESCSGKQPPIPRNISRINRFDRTFNERGGTLFKMHQLKNITLLSHARKLLI